MRYCCERITMFYTFENGLQEHSGGVPENRKLTAAYITVDELQEVAAELGFEASTVEACRTANDNFRSAVETYGDYTFTELRITEPEGGDDDCIALYIARDLFLVVDVADTDRSTYQKYLRCISKQDTHTVTLEKLVYSFLDLLLEEDVYALESIGDEISEIEESIVKGEPEPELNSSLLILKRKLQRTRNYYSQILDIIETLEADENGIFGDIPLLYLGNMESRVNRLEEDTASLTGDVLHLQDAYSGYLDKKMNDTMKYLTVLSTVFFPLTIIVGWYGMNFVNMPELYWKGGYVFVVLLSVAVVLVSAWIAKKKKWF